MIFNNVKSIVIPEGSVKEITCNNVTLWQKIRTIIETVSGVGTIVLQKVIQLVSITQYGKCEQASTPTPSAPVDIKCNNGAIKVGREIYTTPLGRTVYGGTLDVTTGVLTVDRAMVDLGTLNWEIDGTRFKASVNGMANKAGRTIKMLCDCYKSLVNGEAYDQNANNVCYGAYSRVYVHDFAYTDASIFKTAVTGHQLCYELATPQTYQLTPQTVEMIAERSMFQSNANGNIDITYYANGILKTVSGNPVVITDADGQNAENVTVHIEPIQSGSGTPSQTNIRPISGMTDINITRIGGVVADGTPEVLTVTGKNLFNKNDSQVGKNWNGNKMGYSIVSSYIPAKKGEAFTLSISDMPKYTSTTWVALDSNYRYMGTVSNGNPITQDACAYIRLSIRCADTDSWTQSDLENAKIQLERGSTATAYEPYSAQTASVENLFAVEDYKDEHEIISGLLTHKCGVKVLTSADVATFSNGCFFVNIGDKMGGKGMILSTHFIYTAGTSSSIADGEMGASGGTSKSTFYKVDGVTSKAEAGAWLAAQYASGTPVVIVYPLAESTEESVTPQSFTVNETATISAESDYIDNIALSGTYETPEA